MATMYMGNQQITPAFVVNSDKYGVSVDAFLGDVDANGVYSFRRRAEVLFCMG